MVKPCWEVAQIRGTLQYQVLTRYPCASGFAKRLRLFNTFIGFGVKPLDACVFAVAVIC